MIFFIYETTNLINGKTYIGCHKTKIVQDGYLGSGKLLRAAINKYGKENFARKILEFCDSEKDMYEREKQYVCEDFVNSEQTYNLRCGGLGGRMNDETRQIISQKLQKPKSIKTRQKMSKARIGKKHTTETKQKILKAILNREPIKESTRALLSKKAKMRKCLAKGTVWITDGTNNKRVLPDHLLPDGWRYGRSY